MLRTGIRSPRGAEGRKTIRGLSIIELLVGVVIGLAIVAGGAKLLADGLMGNRRIVVESKITQDMRAATDIIARDLRRAGYWYWPQVLSGFTATPTPQLGDYRTITRTQSGANVTLTYAYTQDIDSTLNPATEQFGFQRAVSGGIGLIQMQVGNAWQPLTDARTVNITGFTVSPVSVEMRMGDMCLSGPLGAGGVRPTACCRPDPANAGRCQPDVFQRTLDGDTPTSGYIPPAGVTISATCPVLIMRHYDIVVTGQGLAPNTDVVRTIRERVRVRNDQLSGLTCP